MLPALGAEHLRHVAAAACAALAPALLLCRQPQNQHCCRTQPVAHCRGAANFAQALLNQSTANCVGTDWSTAYTFFSERSCACQHLPCPRPCQLSSLCCALRCLIGLWPACTSGLHLDVLCPSLGGVLP
jgi:hypothetical protein